MNSYCEGCRAERPAPEMRPASCDCGWTVLGCLHCGPWAAGQLEDHRGHAARHMKGLERLATGGAVTPEQWDAVAQWLAGPGQPADWKAALRRVLGLEKP